MATLPGLTTNRQRRPASTPLGGGVRPLTRGGPLGGTPPSLERPAAAPRPTQPQGLQATPAVQQVPLPPPVQAAPQFPGAKVQPLPGTSPGLRGRGAQVGGGFIPQINTGGVPLPAVPTAPVSRPSDDFLAAQKRNAAGNLGQDTVPNQSNFAQNAQALRGEGNLFQNRNANVIALLQGSTGVTPEALQAANANTDFADPTGNARLLAKRFGFGGAPSAPDALSGARDRLRALVGGQPVQADLGGPGAQTGPSAIPRVNPDVSQAERFSGGLSPIDASQVEGFTPSPNTFKPAGGGPTLSETLNRQRRGGSLFPDRPQFQRNPNALPQPSARPGSPQPDAPTFGTDITDFGPDATLRGNQIAPGGNAQGNFSGLPDRQQLASETFDLLREQSEPAFQKALQGVGRRAAALGRIGSGVTTSELGDVTALRERDLAQAARGLSLDTAGQAFGDRLTGNEFNFGVGRSNRDELRTERDFQTGQARTAVEDRIRQRLLEDQLQNTGSRRDLDRLRLSGQLGFQPGASRTDLLGSDILAGQSGGQIQSVVDLLRERARGGAAG